MVAAFCLRLATGMVVSMHLLPFAETPPRFCRVHFLSALGLLAIAGFFSLDGMHSPMAVMLGLSLLCCFAGSIVWHLDGAPLARLILLLATGAIVGALCISGYERGHNSEISRMSAQSTERAEIVAVADDLTSAALLGTCMSAMLMGHSYLIAPAMSLTPLMRLLAAMGVALVLRVILAGVGLVQWREAATQADTEVIVWLSLRWGLGFIGLLVLGWMSWESARIRSTQSATGILYVAVIFCFLGELCSQLLTLKMGMPL